MWFDSKLRIPSSCTLVYLWRSLSSHWIPHWGVPQCQSQLRLHETEEYHWSMDQVVPSSLSSQCEYISNLGASLFSREPHGLVTPFLPLYGVTLSPPLVIAHVLLIGHQPLQTCSMWSLTFKHLGIKMRHSGTNHDHSRRSTYTYLPLTAGIRSHLSDKEIVCQGYI